MGSERTPSKALLRMLVDQLAELAESSEPIESNGFVFEALDLVTQLRGVVRFALRHDPIRAATVVHADRWRLGFLQLAAKEPNARAAELERLTARAKEGRTPMEVSK